MHGGSDSKPRVKSFLWCSYVSDFNQNLVSKSCCMRLFLKAKKLNIAVGESLDLNKLENELLANVSGETKRFLKLSLIYLGENLR